MLSHHETDELNGKVSTLLIDSYNMDYQNYVLASIVAGFHRIYGRRNEGIYMSLEIIENIDDDTENLWERNILVWNLYILSREFIDDGEYDNALKLIVRAEKNWSRDVILGDEIGVYHVSWLEQILLRKAEVYLLTGQIEMFEMVTDQILVNRFEFFNTASEVTGETIIGDRCTYNCLELMSFDMRKRDIDKGIGIIKQAILHRGGTLNNFLSKPAVKEVNSGNKYKAFDMYLRYYFELPDKPFDNCIYGYCRTCMSYDRKGTCTKFNIATDNYKSCSYYTGYNMK